MLENSKALIKIWEKKAKSQMYDFIIKQLPDTKRKTLYQDNSSDDLPETEVSAISILSTPLTHTSSHFVTAFGNSENMINENVKSLPETEVDITIESHVSESSGTEI
ncbi:hypothetical protein F8M41_021663 [Gigaspora margarita]|uniref:Uncharacterized protein n=1 Tax=Gigaspora margarita TaxID=4874 RepID=A0A8H4AGF0_GIGMA|nr:hypothetical protein F8M41_021663 [Gigaspora margarita]